MFEWILKLICSEERIRSIFSWLDTNWGIQLETKAQTQERLQEEAKLEHERVQKEQERVQKEQERIQAEERKLANEKFMEIKPKIEELLKDEAALHEEELNKINEAIKNQKKSCKVNNPEEMEIKEEDIIKLLDLKHIQKESNRFEKISNPDVLLPKQTATGQAYKFKKTRKKGEDQKDKHEKIWYGKSSSAGEVAKAIGMIIFFPRAAKYRFVENGIPVGKNDVKNVFSQEIKGKTIANYVASKSLEEKKLAMFKLMRSDDCPAIISRFYKRLGLANILADINNLLENVYLTDENFQYLDDMFYRLLKYPTHFEKIFDNEFTQRYLYNECPLEYFLTETQNKELLRASFYNYVTGNWDGHNNNLMITEDEKQIIPFDFDVVYNGYSRNTLNIINNSKKYLGPDKFKEYIQEFIVDLEIKKDQYHSAMETLYQILKIKGRPYDKTEIETNLQTLKILAGIPLEQKKETWVEHSTSQNQSSDKQITQ